MKKMTRSEMAALKRLDGINARFVPDAMVNTLAAKGLCTAQGNITDAGRVALPFRTRLARAAMGS